MQIGTKVKLRDDGPIYEIVDIEFDIIINSYLSHYKVTKIKVDINWYTPEEFNERFRVIWFIMVIV